MDVITLQSLGFDRITEEEFFHFCQDNKQLLIERGPDGLITVRPPVSSVMSMINAGIAFGSSAGFSMPNRAGLSPDASWMPQGRWQAISPVDRQRFAHACPDFVVELLSPTDRLTDTMRKMEHWLEAGARLGWLIAPGTESVYIFEPDQPVRPVVGFDQNLVASPVLPGFALELRRLRAGCFFSSVILSATKDLIASERLVQQ